MYYYQAHFCKGNSYFGLIDAAFSWDVYYGNPNMTKLSNSNIASAQVQRSNYPKYQECKRSKTKYCRCKNGKGQE